MRSVADDLRHERTRRELALSSEERVALALALHRRDVEIFRLAHDPPLAPAEASLRLRRERRRGRVRSVCVEAIEG